MITAVWRKHWMELRGRWATSTAFALLPGILVALIATARRGFHLSDGLVFFVFAFFLLGIYPIRFSGTGLTTFAGVIAQRGADPSLLFTLSLPVRRRTLFFYRSVFGLLAMETAAAAAWAVYFLLLVHMGASWHALVPLLWLLPALVPLLWLLPALVPFYFLDSLLLMRFSEMTAARMQMFTLVILPLALHYWLGVPFEKMGEIVLHPFTLLPVGLAMCLLSAALAATTVWRLDQQNY